MGKEDFIFIKESSSMYLKNTGMNGIVITSEELAAIDMQTNKVKFSPEIDVSQISDSKEAKQFVDDFVAQNFPEADPESLDKTIQEFRSHNAQEQKYGALYSLSHSLKEVCDRALPQMLGKYNASQTENGRYRNTEKLNKAEAAVIEEFVRDSIDDSLSRKCESQAATPYQKISPIKKFLNPIYKTLGSKRFDEKTEVAKRLHLPLMGFQNNGWPVPSSLLQEEFEDVNASALSLKGAPSSRKAQATEKDYQSSAEYLQCLKDLPYEQLIEKVVSDEAVFEARADAETVQVADLREQLKKSFLQNFLHERVKNVLEKRMQNHLNLAQSRTKTRTNLAAKKLMPAKEIKAKSPKHPVVQLDQRIAAKQKSGR